MANVFDQFDNSPNPFDKFDEPKIPIVPEGPVPVMQTAPPQWKIDASNFAHEFLPGMGAGAGALAGGAAGAPTGPGALLTSAAGSGMGLAIGRKAAEGVDTLLGVPDLHPPQSGQEAALRTTKDILEGGTYELGARAAMAPVEFGAKKLANYLGNRGARGFDEGKLNEIVQRAFRKAIRPSVAGKKTWSQRIKSMGKIGDAVQAIIDNKKMLRFVDEAGNEVSGVLPRNLDEFAQAIDQTKRAIFQKYNAIKTQAGEQGITIDLTPLARDIENLVDTKPFRVNAPNAKTYGEELAQRLSQEGTMTLDEAQDALQGLNSTLEAWHKNPNPSAVQTNTVDNFYANQLRSALNDAISSATGPEYKELRRLYGAIKSIEGEVNHRAIVAGRTNAKGLSDMLHGAASTAAFTHGLLQANPEMIAVGATLRGMNKVFKNANDPNRIIAKMFEQADSLITKGAEPTAASSLAAKIAGRNAATRSELRSRIRSERQPKEPMARGHVPVLSGPEQLALPPGQGFEAPGIAPNAVVGESMARGHIPYREYPPPMPYSAEESAKTLAAYPPQSPAAEIAPVFDPKAISTLRVSPAAQSAAVFEKAFAENQTPQARGALLQRFQAIRDDAERAAAEKAMKFSPQLIEHMGGSAETGVGPYWEQAPKWLRQERSAYQPPGVQPQPPPLVPSHGAGSMGALRQGPPLAQPSENWVEQEIRAALPEGTPDWLIAEHVKRALGR